MTQLEFVTIRWNLTNSICHVCSNDDILRPQPVFRKQRHCIYAIHWNNLDDSARFRDNSMEYHELNVPCKDAMSSSEKEGFVRLYKRAMYVRNALLWWVTPHESSTHCITLQHTASHCNTLCGMHSYEESLLMSHLTSHVSLLMTRLESVILRLHKLNVSCTDAVSAWKTRFSIF